MKIITQAKNFSLNQTQEEFIQEKIVKIRDFSKTIEDQSHQIHLDFEHIESQKKEDNIVCIATLNLSWHNTIRVEKSAETVEKAFMEVKKVLLEDMKKIKWKNNCSWIHCKVIKKIKWFFGK